MPVNLADYEQRAQEAVRHFWQARATARANQAARGATDQGNRAAVTAGTTMAGFVDEESLGAAVDFWKAWSEGVFTGSRRPLLGYLLLLEDSPTTRTPAAKPFRLTHFLVLNEFQQTSYADRYDLFCQKVVHSGLYGAATVLLTAPDGSVQGIYSEVSAASGLRQFVAQLAGHVATAAAIPPMPPSVP